METDNVYHEDVDNRQQTKEKKEHFKVNINKRNIKPRIWIMKMYDPNEDDHSYMDMEMLPNMYLN